MSLGKKLDITKHVHSPDGAVDSALRLIQSRIDDPKTGIQQRIPGANFLMPLHAGEMIAIVGYTSNGKSSFANYIVTQHGYQLRSYIQQDPSYRHIVLYATWEQSIEEQTILDLSRVTAIPASKIFRGELDKYEVEKIWDTGAKDRRSLPIWLIGSSINDDRRRVRFSMEDINQGLMFLEEEMGVAIDMIVLDYLQRIRRPLSRSGDMREGFMENVDAAKDMAIKCPLLLLSQAGRQVRSREWQLPDLDDGQETSNLEQSSDHYYSVWMPKQTRRPSIVVEGLEYAITDNLLVVGYLKQKQGPAPIIRVYEMGIGGTYLKEANGKTPSNEGKRRSQRE